MRRLPSGRVSDLIIIGGGAAAFAAAIRANELGLSTQLINAGLPLGGTCVNVGCVPSKALIHAAEIAHRARHHGIPGLQTERTLMDVASIVDDELALVEKMREEKYVNVLHGLQHVQSHQGYARFVSPFEVSVDRASYRGKKFLIATGSTALVPDVPGLRDVGFLTHVEALRCKQPPRSLIVIGAGPVGLELAQLYARFGTKVTILQRHASIFPPADAKLTQRLRDILTSEGITIHSAVAITNARADGHSKVVTFTTAGTRHDVRADEILVASGKAPNTKNLSLGVAGVVADEQGAIVVDPFLQTSQAHIFAAGDVANLPLRLETTAGHEGTLAVENAFTGTRQRIDYGAVPYTVFTDPQLAGVGLQGPGTDRRRRARRTLPLTSLPKAVISRQTAGAITMTIDADTREILQLDVLAPHASEIVSLGALLIANKNTIDDVQAWLPVFPSMSEAVKLVARSFTHDVSKLSCCV